MKNQPVLVGPFIGDFRTEIFEFWPWANWIRWMFYDYKHVYVASHINRSFLYEDFFNFIPVHEHLSFDELDQKSTYNKQIEPIDFKFCIKRAKNKIIEKQECNKKDILDYNLKYTRNRISIPITEKIWRIPKVDIELKKRPQILFIPDKYGNINQCGHVYKYLLENWKNETILSGDTKIHFPEQNPLFQEPEYLHKSYKYLIKMIEECDILVAPFSHWTILGNIYKKNVFSWGKQVGIYRELFTFNNEGFKNYYHSRDMDINILIKQLNSVLIKLYGS